MSILIQKREKYLDILKGLAILMVINVHFPKGTALFKGITFHLTTFFIVAGILIRKKEEDKLSYRDIIKKKLKSMIYPYFTLSFVYILVYSIIKHSITNIYRTLSFLGIGTLWFLPTLFLGELIFITLLKKFKKHINIIIPLLLIISITFSYYLTIKGITGFIHLSMDKIFESIICNIIIVLMQAVIASAYIGVGYIIECIIHKTNCLKFNKIYYLLLGCTLLIINYFVANRINADLHYAKMYTPIYYLLGTLLGTIGIFNIAYSMEGIKVINKTIGWLGKNSLIIMTTHLECQIVNISYKIVQYIPVKNRIICSIIMFVAILLIETLIINIINNTKLKYLYKMPKLRKHTEEDL